MFEATQNALAEYGQAVTPAAGSQIKRLEIKDEDQQGFFDRLKDRYVWMPLHDVDFVGKMAHQPMSFIRLYRGRIAWVQPVSYKAVDNSPEAFDQIGDEEAPLRSFVCTPFAQCVYLYLNWGQKGLRVLEHLKGAQPELVSYLEELILPDVPTDLISLGKYIAEEAPKRIAEAGLDHKTQGLAQETMTAMLSGVNDAIKYCRELIAESEGEILTRQNKGWGKSHLDTNDRYAYAQTRKTVPAESTLDNSPERRTNELLEKFVNSIAGVKIGNRDAAAEGASAEEINALRQELAATQQKLLAFIEKQEALTSGAPSITDNTVASKDDAEKALQTRLSNTKKK